MPTLWPPADVVKEKGHRTKATALWVFLLGAFFGSVGWVIMSSLSMRKNPPTSTTLKTELWRLPDVGVCVFMDQGCATAGSICISQAVNRSQASLSKSFEGSFEERQIYAEVDPLMQSKNCLLFRTSQGVPRGDAQNLNAVLQMWWPPSLNETDTEYYGHMASVFFFDPVADAADHNRVPTAQLLPYNEIPFNATAETYPSMQLTSTILTMTEFRKLSGDVRHYYFPSSSQVTREPELPPSSSSSAASSAALSSTTESADTSTTDSSANSTTSSTNSTSSSADGLTTSSSSAALSSRTESADTSTTDSSTNSTSSSTNATSNSANGSITSSTDSSTDSSATISTTESTNRSTTVSVRAESFSGSTYSSSTSGAVSGATHSTSGFSPFLPLEDYEGPWAYFEMQITVPQRLYTVVSEVSPISVSVIIGAVAGYWGWILAIFSVFFSTKQIGPERKLRKPWQSTRRDRGIKPRQSTVHTCTEASFEDSPKQQPPLGGLVDAEVAPWGPKGRLSGSPELLVEEKQRQGHQFRVEEWLASQERRDIVTLSDLEAGAPRS